MMKIFLLFKVALTVEFLVNPDTSSDNILVEKSELTNPNLETIQQIKLLEKFEAAESILCNQDILISYGMKGKHYAEVSTHEYCPHIVRNCCTKNDAVRSMNLWRGQSRYLTERYYQTYLTSLKYLLGFSAEAFLLAREMEMTNKKECKSAAVDLIALDLNPQTTLQLYHHLRDSIKKIIPIRSGFYCSICDADFQKEMTDFWLNTNLLNID